MVPRILQQLPPRFRKKQLSGMHGLGSFLHPCRPGLSLALHGTQSDSWTAPQSSASKGLHPRLQLHHPLSRSDQIHGHHPGLSFMAGRWQVFGKMLPLCMLPPLIQAPFFLRDYLLFLYPRCIYHPLYPTSRNPFFLLLTVLFLKLKLNPIVPLFKVLQRFPFVFRESKILSSRTSPS